TGDILGDKLKTNLAYQQAGLSVPAIVAQGSVSTRVFANARVGTRTSAKVLDHVENLDEGDYNTSFIDTAQAFRGSYYYVCLRALTCLDKLIAVYVRARPVTEGDPSVHARDTPLDAPLLVHLHKTLVKGR